MNEAQVTMIGYVASMPKLVQTKGGRFVTHMRVGVTPRLLDRETGQWSDGTTSYVTVTCWRQLAANVAACLRKGDPILVKGRMRVRQYDDKDGNQRTTVEVDASTLGHDLTRGVAHFLRTKRSPGEAPLALTGYEGANDGTGARTNGEWPGRPDQPGPGMEHVTDDEFSGADLFDDAEVEVSARLASGSADPDRVTSDPEGGGAAEVAGPARPAPDDAGIGTYGAEQAA